MEQKQIAKTLASFAPAYQNAILKIDQNENWKKQFNENGNGNYIALQFFLEHFAYERAGSPKAYREIAKLSIEKVFEKEEIGTISSAQPTTPWSTTAWGSYKDITKLDFNGININENCNPMNCKDGVLAIMEQKTEDMNIANYVKKQIDEQKTKAAHKFVDNIKGIGPKIASFYLRDIAYLAGLEKKGINDPFLLQPMDTWLEQTYIIMEGEKPANREEKQKFFVGICLEAGCSPIEFNQGAWFAGSQIVRGDFNKFKKIALGEAESKEIVKDYVKKQRHYFSEIEKALDRN